MHVLERQSNYVVKLQLPYTASLFLDSVVICVFHTPQSREDGLLYIHLYSQMTHLPSVEELGVETWRGVKLDRWAAVLWGGGGGV